ncbi:MAG: aminoacyl-tRNA hydrolase [Candidatus Woykebacteria bacterium RIFCSPLOWO2_01_FULL_41_12]|uniref:Peptidyl-tRNA hydrolase n=1 Tax=Candidatus Woykebacteria bacterium RIFCSPLOWO2_01_FULL_41_12 TaxID=1802604 RepID=A0A1G1WYH3_9BACT|nr:MAG: aminoacyl-tRNA hydrolase [Candidatus Woykebacteria bacterium RIFCSPLOWO2_01_FULL_41_12]
MRIVVGLGNPGEKYANTRHNAGFMVIDEILKDYVAGPKYNKKFEAIIYSLDKNRLLIKPQTFMNISGKTVNRVVNFYKIKPEDLLIVHDDVDLEFSEIKHQFGRGAAGHKGVQSIVDSLGSDQFNRVRIGIGRPKDSTEVEKWVLQGFSEEKSKVDELIKKATEITVNWLKEKD